jgi:hypothetical protein
VTGNDVVCGKIIERHSREAAIKRPPLVIPFHLARPSGTRGFSSDAGFLID